MKVSDLAPVVALAGSIDDAARLRLAAVAADLRAVESEIADLARNRPAPDVLAAPGGLRVHALHLRWTASRREALLRRLAEIRARFEAARLAAAQAHGRKMALDELLADAERDAARQRDRLHAARLAACTPGPIGKRPG